VGTKNSGGSARVINNGAKDRHRFFSGRVVIATAASLYVKPATDLVNGIKWSSQGKNDLADLAADPNGYWRLTILCGHGPSVVDTRRSITFVDIDIYNPHT
jgi:hypothetical protein